MYSRSGPAMPEVPRDRLEPVTRQIARREVVAQHRVERVDQLAPGRDEPDPARRIGAAGSPAARAALPQSRRPDPPERERHAEEARAPVEERQVEAVQVVVLDHVRIGGLHPRDQPADQVGLAGIAVAARLEHLGRARRIAHRDHEDAIARGIEPGRLEIELHAAQLVEREIAEVVAPGRDQVLLLRRQREHGVLAQLAQVPDAPSQPPRRASSTAAVSVFQSSARTR